jgi:hypothetical protein
MLPPPRFSISGTTARDSPISEYALTSSAMRKLSRDVSTNGILQRVGGANAGAVDAEVEAAELGVERRAEIAIC